MNVKAIARNVGLALLVSALFMLLSAGVSLIYGKDSGFGPLMVAFTITFIVGVFPFIFIRGQQHGINLQEGYVTIVLSWLLSFVFGMVPYVMWGGEISIADAWFESVSGFTTTGATILSDIEALPHSLLFWRSSTHFIGGLGVVVFLLLVLPSASPFRRKLTSLEVSSLTREGYQMQSTKLVKVISGVYFSIFALAALSLWIAGMPLFDAVNHAFSVCATGGFSTKNASVMAYDSIAIDIVLLFFMIVATTNFALIFTCCVRRSLKPLLHNKIWVYYIISVAVMSAIVVLSLKVGGVEDSLGALVKGTATVISYVTTTGFAFADNAEWPFLAGIVLLYASIQCATAGSTSSGIKMDRMIVAFKCISRQMKSNLHPSAASRLRLGRAYLPDEQVLPILLYIVLYFIIAGISVCLLLVCRVGGTEAVSGAISCLGNVGPGLGAISAAGNFDSFPVMAKIICTVDMFLGRIEIYPLLIAVSLLFKKNR